MLGWVTPLRHVTLRPQTAALYLVKAPSAIDATATNPKPYARDPMPVLQGRGFGRSERKRQTVSG